MSLLPPTPFMMSKVKYLLQRKLTGQTDLYTDTLEKVMRVLRPFPIFRLSATFRGAVADFEEAEYGYSLVNRLIGEDERLEGAWTTDCVDTALNHYTALRKALPVAEQRPGIVHVTLQGQPEDASAGWSDLYLDEFSVNIRGSSTPRPQEEEKEAESKF